MHEKELRAVSFLLQKMKNDNLIKIGLEHLLHDNGYPDLTTLCDSFGNAVEVVMCSDGLEVDITILQNLKVRIMKDA